MYRGDAPSWRFLVTDEDHPLGTDLTGVLDVRFTAKRRSSDDDVDAVITKTVGSGVTITDPATSGYVEVALLPVDTNSETTTVTFVWDLQVTGAAGDPHTVASGTLRVDPDISRTAP
jgi:hypothetical protein